MSDFLSPADARRTNRSKIFHYIYSEKYTSKPAIAQALQLSLPTVTQHLTDLLNEGLIQKKGLLKSTGGRKAQSYQCNPSFKYAVGVDIWNDKLEIVISDLHGQSLKEESPLLQFSNTNSYYQQLCSLIKDCVRIAQIPYEDILGVGISLQGIVSADGSKVIYGDAMNTIGITLQSFSDYLPWPCLLIHNVESAAFAESFALQKSDLTEAVYLSLNNYFGGTLILNGNTHRGEDVPSGAIEHMCLVPDGLPCYCGKRGCVDAYCSVNSLKSSANEDLNTFFDRLRQGQDRETTIWNGYLRKLALAIDNIRMVFGSKVILGGYLNSYLTNEDIRLLEDYVLEQSAFKTGRNFIRRDMCGKNAAAKGAALQFITHFLDSI